MDAPKPANWPPLRTPAVGRSHIAAGAQKPPVKPVAPVMPPRAPAAFSNQPTGVCQRSVAPPPVYRPNAPQINPTAAASPQVPRGAPPVYRPANASSILRRSAAPPIYRPNMGTPILPVMSKLPPGAPPVYRPSAAIQRQSAPPVYRPQATAGNVPRALAAPPLPAIQPKNAVVILAPRAPFVPVHRHLPIQRLTGFPMPPIQRQIGNWSVIQCGIPEDVQEIRNALLANPPESLRAILEEILDVYGWRNVQTVYGRSGYESEINIEGTHDRDRQYQVVIDDKQVTDDTQRQSYIVHELMHASVDERYLINRRLNEKTLNAVYDSSAPERVAGEQFRHGRDLAAALQNLVEQERTVLGSGLADHLVSRLKRIQGANTQEFDTVISELYYYVWRRGVSQQTATYREIVRLAEGAAASRHHQRPITGLGATTYRPVRSGGGCVITTACVESRGLPDDCEELRVLREFRDQYIRRQEDGETRVALYYQVAPEIVAAIQACSDSAERFDRLFGVIQLCVTLVKDGQLEDALAIYQAMVVKLKRQYLDQQNCAADAFVDELLGPVEA